MKTENLLLAITTSVLLTGAIIKTGKPDLTETTALHTQKAPEEKPCVFMSVMGEQPVDRYSVYKNASGLKASLDKGEKWLAEAQNKDGGWGAGSHSNQGEMNPHAVSSDPATTAMAAMSLYRMGFSIEKGRYKQQLTAALNYLLHQVEENKNKEFNINIK